MKSTVDTGDELQVTRAGKRQFPGWLRSAPLWAAALAVLSANGAAAEVARTGTDGATNRYVFTSFRGNGEDGLHLALSYDGHRWSPLNHGKPVLRSGLGAKLMRDPCLASGPDGTFHLVWTTGWTAEQGRILGYAHSSNLVAWSVPRALEVMEHEPATRNIWAPEIFYDATNGQWLIFWSSTIPGRFPDTEQTGDDGYNHRIYVTTTKDFRTVGASRLFYDPGFNCIDATLLKAGGRYVMFFKDERKNPVKKNLRYAWAAEPTGPFGPPSEPFTGDWVEGPSAVRIGEWTYVYFDHYAQPHYYGAVRSKDLKTWEDVSKTVVFPSGHRHGTVMSISLELAAALEEIGDAAHDSGGLP